MAHLHVSCGGLEIVADIVDFEFPPDAGEEPVDLTTDFEGEGEEGGHCDQRCLGSVRGRKKMRSAGELWKREL